MGTLNSGRRYCCEISEKQDLGKQVTVCGWVARSRNLGALIFTDIRDRSGIIQCVFDDTTDKALFALAEELKSEFTVKVTGTVRMRSSINEKLPTGRIEILADALQIFSKAQTPPFEINDEINVNDTLKLKHRYLDLRRPSFQRNLALRHRAAMIARQYFDEQGFLEIETPILTKSTPEGARDYLVPSRLFKGEFYALPQSPQQYKQLLMLAGFDRYMQLARCFRDEDLRYDRQPEFTQIDLEMSFVDADDVMEINEGFICRIFKELLGVELARPFLRMPYSEAMARFGSDKPDLRFGYELLDITSWAKGCGFSVFESVCDGGYIGLLNLKNRADKLPRKEIDALGEYVKTYKAKGLAWLKAAGDGAVTSSFMKFLTEEKLEALKALANVEPNDVLLCVADGDIELAQNALGALRCEVAKRLGDIPEGAYKPLWVIDFPLFEYGEDELGNTRLYAKHHPFTAPKDEDLALFETAPETMRAKAYDLVLNGTELGGGSIRIHQSDVQSRMFKALGFKEEEIAERFGHMINAFQYGAPPHGGIAYGFDRLCMWLAGTENIREVIAFPKAQNASELMMGSPSPVDARQLSDLGIAITPQEKKD